MSGVNVVIEDLSTHPSCVHGPTLLFSRDIDGHKRFYYACSACRDRKKCSYFVWQDEVEKYVNKKINKQIVEHQKLINHRSLFLKLHKVKGASEDQRLYCNTCDLLDLKENSNAHEDHDVKNGVTDYELEHPSEFLKPLDDSKKEAQYLFTEKCVTSIIEMLQHLGKKNVICIGTPRIFEYINSNMSTGMNAILLDFDSRYHSFFGPLQFSWFNMFNNHFFKEDGKEVFRDFLKSTNVSDTILVTDPPFGGRVEPISDTFSKMNNQFKKVHKTDKDLPIFWIFPYFMEPHILNSMNNFAMLDYKVDYDNHPLFQQGKGGRKFGSPVRIFTNLEASSITLPVEEGYKYCSICEKWVAEENKHCEECNACTSKDGRTYVHCAICDKCVKPSWKHCKKCRKCAIETHKCGQLPFTKDCLHCKKPGHKKVDCPELNQNEVTRKRNTEVNKEHEEEESLEQDDKEVTKKRKLKVKPRHKKEVCSELNQNEGTTNIKSEVKSEDKKEDSLEQDEKEVTKKKKLEVKPRHKKEDCPELTQNGVTRKRKSEVKQEHKEEDCLVQDEKKVTKRKKLEVKPGHKKKDLSKEDRKEFTKKRKLEVKSQKKTKKLKKQ